MVGPGKTYAPLGSALRRALSIASVRRGIGSLCSRPPFIRSGARINVADRKSISAHASRKASRKRNPVAASNSSACRCVPLSVLPLSSGSFNTAAIQAARRPLSRCVAWRDIVPAPGANHCQQIDVQSFPARRGGRLRIALDGAQHAQSPVSAGGAFHPSVAMLSRHFGRRDRCHGRVRHAPAKASKSALYEVTVPGASFQPSPQGSHRTRGPTSTHLVLAVA